MHCLSFFVWIGTILAFFHSIGNFIWLRHDLKIIERGLHKEGPHSFNIRVLIIERGLHKEGPHSFNIRILIVSWPWALLGFRLFIIFIVFSFDIWTLLRRFSVRNSKLFGSSLLVFSSEYWSAKNVLKSSAFSLKSIKNLLLWNTGGMHGIFLSFKNVFNVDQ